LSPRGCAHASKNPMQTDFRKINISLWCMTSETQTPFRCVYDLSRLPQKQVQCQTSATRTFKDTLASLAAMD